MNFCLITVFFSQNFYHRSHFFDKKGGVECLFLTKNNDRFVDGLAGSFEYWIVYLWTNVKPPLFLDNFEKITCFV